MYTQAELRLRKSIYFLALEMALSNLVYRANSKWDIARALTKWTQQKFLSEFFCKCLNRLTYYWRCLPHIQQEQNSLLSNHTCFSLKRGLKCIAPQRDCIKFPKSAHYGSNDMCKRTYTVFFSLILLQRGTCFLYAYISVWNHLAIRIRAVPTLSLRLILLPLDLLSWGYPIYHCYNAKKMQFILVGHKLNKHDYKMSVGKLFIVGLYQ